MTPFIQVKNNLSVFSSFTRHICRSVMIVQTVSPVVLRLKVADRDESSTTSNCKLVLQWGPLDEGGGSVDPEDDQCGLPYPLLLGPHVGITVCSTCHYAVTFGSPVNTCNTTRRDCVVLTHSCSNH